MKTKRFYAIENGDTWDLIEEDERLLVLHQPNLSSGGVSKRTTLAEFLTSEPHTAQNIALVRLIGSLLD